ncbi:MAG: xylulose 5-phosphate 3-epimerase [Gammaproteobacteria bacterium]|nr:xylulose 5-phosphate 3-epimerase [Gammaproteobacteria bacterium]MBU0786545.1 xylulose 5-phosphate 3-epimerase [Gammaproteobacteria bacterium]MBU0817153.1 xylulose 5-phosphate 3-epimerase [Gammaproteobacteria bacterium]MBU1787726.1 xylulose 5-phosphate 3-epimerase [Gammaproteobacteria bacterium]
MQHEKHRDAVEAEAWRRDDMLLEKWAGGYGVIRHENKTQLRVQCLVSSMLGHDTNRSAEEIWKLFTAADRLTSAAMWLVAHMTYAKSVHIDGRPLEKSDFKAIPNGHTGGSLNMVPAYVGYLLANALTGSTRSWLMGQGHCVAAIDAVNVLVGNLHPEQASRYNKSQEGLSRLCDDFYSYAISPSGEPAAPLGSHVNAHTAGGLIEGGYLGFAELQYVHMPLPGETLVAFLSDGAFEEQRGADWAPRWWRANDSGLVLPIMLLNGRRIEQRSSMAQDGGSEWFSRHLRLNGFDPIEIDGTDPAAFTWAILEAESRLSSCVSAAQEGALRYPAPLHYTIAKAPKGYGFPGAGTNLAHNLPLGSIPAIDPKARNVFNEAVHTLWVSQEELAEYVSVMCNHDAQGRPRERDHALSVRRVSCVAAEIPWSELSHQVSEESPMQVLDRAFIAIARANPELRVRVGNPDELRSNGMAETLENFRHRSVRPEINVPEALDGAVITALNEEAVISAALANKAGLNLVVSYEAFAVKMLGAMRQEMNFARQQAIAGRPPGWLSVPVVLTSHAWENGKNELSHQDTTLSEVWMVEPCDRARVLFPPDANTVLACLEACYKTQGEIWTLVVPKRPIPCRLDRTQSRRLVTDGAIRIHGSGRDEERLVLISIGAYQLNEVMRASRRLSERNVSHAVIVVIEPGRLRVPRDDREAIVTLSDKVINELFPMHSKARVVLSHTRTELLAGVLRRIDTGRKYTWYLGFNNRGGTLDTFGMLFANQCTWAHVLATAANALDVTVSSWLSDAEIEALQGRSNPQVLR